MIKKLLSGSLILLLLGSGLTVLTQPKHISAANSASWQAGRIIDDSLFTDPRSMSASQVQDFLNQKVGTGGYGRAAGQCDTNGVATSEYGGGTRAQYGAAHNNPAPFTCLKDFYEVPKTTPSLGIPANNYGGKPIPAGAKSAAQIIYDAAQEYNISPKVLLVTIQKESAGPLTTDDWPFLKQYTYAMGAHCPDTAACDENYAGFSIQIYESARLFRYYLDNMTQSWWPYKKPGVNNVLYNPNTGCGSNDVNIVSKATAALYTYTPYQPNQAALNNLYGSGDSCSAYGNRNFWRIYNDWFGTTTLEKPVSNIDWKFENLVGGSPTLTPTTNTVGIQPKSIVYNNKLFVFYYDATQKVLRLDYADSTGWHDAIIDGTTTTNGRLIGDEGRSLTTAIYNQTLHIYYYDATLHSLRHGWYTDDNGWNFETLDGSASSVSGKVADVGMSNAAVDSGGGMHVFYYDATNTNLRHAWYYPAQGWKFENLEGDYGSISGLNADIGQNPEVANYGGSLQLFYYDVSNGNLRHAWASATQGWKFENLDGDSSGISHQAGNVGQDPSFTANQGSLQLFYYDVSNGNLRHAWASATQGWKFENLDGDTASIGRNDNNTGSMSRSLSFNNVLYVFYRENSGGLLRYAWADSTGWHFAPLDGDPYSVSGARANTGFWPSPTTFGGALQLFYFDNDQRSLKHTFGIPYY
jgi:hypothetical protein